MTSAATALLRRYAPIAAWFWAILTTGLLVVSVVGGFVVRLDAGLWHYGAENASKWFLLGMGAILVGTHLPIFVAHGVTRRTFLLGGALLTVAAAVTFGVLVLVGYGLEYAALTAGGRTPPDGYPVSSLGLAFGTLGRSIVLFAGYLAGGVWVGACYYRFGNWIGLLLVPTVFVPITAVEFGSAAPGPVSFGAAGAAMALTVLGIYCVARAIPIRPRKT